MIMIKVSILSVIYFFEGGESTIMTYPLTNSYQYNTINIIRGILLQVYKKSTVQSCINNNIENVLNLAIMHDVL